MLQIGQQIVTHSCGRQKDFLDTALANEGDLERVVELLTRNSKAHLLESRDQRVNITGLMASSGSAHTCACFLECVRAPYVYAL